MNRELADAQTRAPTPSRLTRCARNCGALRIGGA
jgi:hypothetical protein